MSLENKINALKEEFYSNNKKNTFFKNKQKLEYAKKVSDSIELGVLLKNTFITNDEINVILFQYPIFKNYANYDNIMEILNYFVNLVNKKISKFDEYRLFANLDTYSATAHERFKGMYTMLFEIDDKNSVIFNNKLHSLVVFNSPHILSSLNSFFSSYVSNDVINKVFLVSKKDTEDRVDKLISKINNLNI